VTAGGWLAAVLIVGLLIVPLLWATIDAARYPGWAWKEAGYSKVGWVTLLAAGTILIFIGFVAFFIYGGSIRAQVRDAAGLKTRTVEA
jgi:hypothetical protein